MRTPSTNNCEHSPTHPCYINLLTSRILSSKFVATSEFHEPQLNKEHHCPTTFHKILPKQAMATLLQCCGMSLRVLAKMLWGL